MKKIYKLKQWYSLDDAAKRLTQTLSETIEQSDILELAIEGHIQLYWYMRHVPAKEVEFTKKEIPKLRHIDNNEFENSKDADTFIAEGYFEKYPHNPISYHNGAHILLLDKCGALLDYLRSHLMGTGKELISLNGFYIQDNKGRIWNVLERFDEKNIEKRGMNSYYNSKNYFPSNEWPFFSELGFDKAELEKFENALNDHRSKEMASRERSTLLKMVIGMAKDGYGYIPSSARSPFPKELEGVLNRLGIEVSDDTIRKWLKEASDYLPQNGEVD